MSTTIEYTEEEVTAYQAGRWGTTIEAVRKMSIGDNLHHAMYGSECGQCPVADSVRHIAVASYRERQTTLFEEVSKLPPQARLHLLLWGPDACPDVPQHKD